MQTAFCSRDYVFRFDAVAVPGTEGGLHMSHESNKSEFLALVWPKRVKNCGEKLYTPLAQSLEAKYSLQVKIFEFEPSGCTPVENTESKFSTLGRPKQVSGSATYATCLLFQGLRIQI